MPARRPLAARPAGNEMTRCVTGCWHVLTRNRAGATPPSCTGRLPTTASRWRHHDETLVEPQRGRTRAPTGAAAGLRSTSGHVPALPRAVDTPELARRPRLHVQERGHLLRLPVAGLPYRRSVPAKRLVHAPGRVFPAGGGLRNRPPGPAAQRQVHGSRPGRAGYWHHRLPAAQPVHCRLPLDRQ